MLEKTKEIARISDRAIAKFNPEKSRETISALKAAIKHAKEMQDWEAGWKAVDWMIEEQRDFVAWWRTNVRGKGKNANNADRGYFVEDAQKQTKIKQQQVSRWGKLLQQPNYREQLFYPSYREGMAAAIRSSQLIQQSLSVEHYTPEQYIAAARCVLERIDLDPASSQKANKIVKAAKFFDIKMNGLQQKWFGRVWLNPPYGSLPGAFIEKLNTEYLAGNVTAAIVLVNAHCTDTLWFRPLWDGLLCFTDHRINFTGDDERSGSTHGSVFVYFGKRRKIFIDEFSSFGAIVERVK